MDSPGYSNIQGNEKADKLEKKLQKQIQKILKMQTLKIKSKIFSHYNETNNGKPPTIN